MRRRCHCLVHHGNRAPRIYGCCCNTATCRHGTPMSKDNCDWCIADRLRLFGKPTL